MAIGERDGDVRVATAGEVPELYGGVPGEAAVPAAVVEFVAGRQVVRHPEHGARRDRLKEPLRSRGGVTVPDEQHVVVRGQFVVQPPGEAARVIALVAGVDGENDDSR